MHKCRFFIMVMLLLLCPGLSGSNASEIIQNRQSAQLTENPINELAEIRRLTTGQNQTQDKKPEAEQTQPATQAVTQPAQPATQLPQAATQLKSEPNLTSKLSEQEIQALRRIIEQDNKKKSVWSSLDVQLYGYLKTDAAYDTDRVYPGNYALYVDSFPNNKNDNEFNLTANQSRFGFKIAGPDGTNFKTSGLLEFDLYGNYADENKPKIQTRHAYLKLDWPSDRFSILAGQTSDVFSPLNPETLNYTVLWYAGNIAYRRPQIRLTKGLKIGKDSELLFEGAVARTIGRSNTLSTVSESGEDAGYPTPEGRVSLTLPGLVYKPVILGFSGHFGREEYDTDMSGNNKKFDSWSANLDLTMPFSKLLTLKGELFTGENLNAYFGGIGQGVNTSTLKEIRAKGGWVAVTLTPQEQWRFNLGAGIDRVNRDDISNNSKTYNSSVFGNVIYSVNKNTEVGFEVSQLRTGYKNSDDMDDLRLQTAFTYKF